MDISNQPGWLTSLARCLQQGNADTTLLLYLDDILLWWFSKDSSAHSEVFAQLAIELDEKDLQRNFEEFVDQLLIANPINYQKLFPADLSGSQAKTRYRQLIRVFHPDRGEKPEVWLTYRAERVNAAYSEFSRLDESASSSQSPRSQNEAQPDEKPQVTASKPKRKIIPPINTHDVRRWLGSPEKFQKNVIVVLIGLAALLVALLLLSAFVA